MTFKGYGLALFPVVALAILAPPTQAEFLHAGFVDPAGDSLGPVDVVGMLLSFDQATGVYSLILLADPSQPFQGDFRVDINLYNPDTGTTSCDPSLFQDSMNEYTDFPTDTLLYLSGENTYLRSWKFGDRLATNSAPFGNPDCTSEFHSAVGDLHDPTQQDRIAEGGSFSELWTSVVFVDGFESADTLAWSETVGLPPPGPIHFISLQVTPGSVPQAGGTLSLLALVRDNVGQGVANAPVSFNTEAGTLGSGGALVHTDSHGLVSDTLTLTAADVGALGSRTFTVTADTVDFEGNLLVASFQVHVQTGAPIADFTFSVNGLTVSFLNHSTGDQPLFFAWNFGDGSPLNTQANPVHVFPVNNTTYNVTLTVTNSVGTDSIQKSVTVGNPP